MKRCPALVLAVGFATAFAVAQTSTEPAPPPKSSPVKIQIAPEPAPSAKDPKADAKKDSKADPKKDAKTDPKADAKKKKEEAMGKVEGMELARPNGAGYLGIRVVDGLWRLTFYNAKRKAVPPDVARAALRWPATYKVGDERMVLNPGGDANSLVGVRVVRPPLSFKLFISLLTQGPDGNDIVTENYTIDFRQ